MKWKRQTGIYRAVLTFQLLLYWLWIVASLTFRFLRKVDSVLWKYIKCLSSFHLVSYQKYSQHDCGFVYCQGSWSSMKKSTGSIIIVYTDLINVIWSTLNLSIRKGIYINLVLEIGNVTLKHKFFSSKLVKSSVLLRSQSKYSANDRSTFYTCQSGRNFKAYLKAMFLLDWGKLFCYTACWKTVTCWNLHEGIRFVKYLWKNTWLHTVLYLLRTN